MNFIFVESLDGIPELLSALGPKSNGNSYESTIIFASYGIILVSTFMFYVSHLCFYDIFVFRKESISKISELFDKKKIKHTFVHNKLASSVRETNFDAFSMSYARHLCHMSTFMCF